MPQTLQFAILPTHHMQDSASPAIPPAIRWVLRGTLAFGASPELELELVLGEEDEDEDEDEEGLG